jgi:hypothetical protein
MKWSAIACSACIAFAASVSAQDKPAAPQQGDPLVLRGCVAAGAQSGTYVMTDVVEVDRAGADKPVPELVNSMLYWFKDTALLAPHAGKRVEVAGKIDGLEQSEVELKAGAQKDGSLVVEIEGPGKDVVADASAFPRAAGTTGKEPETDDTKTTLIKVTMGHVKAIDGTCQ